MTDLAVAAIIITRDRREVLRKALAHLFESGQEGIGEIIVVDNGSGDGTPEMVEAQFPGVRLIRLPRNFGIPEARNIGALNASKELLLFLDDDGFIDCSFLSRFIQFFREDERLAVVTCNVIRVEVESEVEVEVEAAQTLQAMKLGLLSQAQGKRARPALEPTTTFYGGAAMLRRQAFLEAGLFPGHFFYSHEEDDLSFRLIARGYRLALCPEATFVHYRSRSKGWSSGRKRRIFYYYRNRQYVIWRNLPWQVAIRESLATLIGGAVRTLFTPYFPAFLAGSATALMGLVRVIRSERSPLSRERYAHYRELGRESMRYRHRLKGLLLDLFKGRRLDWI